MWDKLAGRAPRRELGVLIVAGFLVPVFAGCLGAGPTGNGGPAADFSQELPHIAGRVLDQELLPVEGAFVTTSDRDAENTTNADGEFLLGPLEPRVYRLVVERKGYAVAEIDVRVVADGPTPVTVTLDAVAGDVPYHTSEVHTTFVICASYNIIGGVPCTKLVDYVAGTNVSADEKFAFTFQIASPGLADMLIEMVWTSQSFGKDMLFMVQTPPNQPLTAATTKYFTKSGGAPLRGWVVAGIANQCGSGECAGVFDAEPNKVTYEALTVWSSGNSTIPFTSLYLNHRADTWMTMFYNRPGSRDFSALPDE